MQRYETHIMRLYVSGPMSGKPRFNFDAFEAATSNLRARGYTVFSPAEMDVEAGIDPDNEGADQEPNAYAEFLARDIRVIAKERIDAIVVLPGWEKSGGANTEVAFGDALGLPILRYPDLKQITGIRRGASHG